MFSVLFPIKSYPRKYSIEVLLQEKLLNLKQRLKNRVSEYTLHLICKPLNLIASQSFALIKRIISFFI